MKAGGRRAVRSAAAALVLAVAVAGCASDEPGPPRDEAAATTPASSPSASETEETSPKVLIVQAFRKMQVSFKRKDARTAVRYMAPRSVKALKSLQRVTATGGPAQIEKLTIWQRLVLTMLRTDYDEGLLGGLSPEGFLDYVFSFDLNYFPAARLRTSSIEITGPRTAVAVVGRSPVWFQLVDDQWKVDVRGVFEGVSLFTKRFAKRRGVSPDDVIRSVAEERTTGAVVPEVWDKP
jgi:hypothetical protein